MEVEVHHYEEINALLRSFRRDRLRNSRGIVQRTFSLNAYQIQIQEEAERSVKSSVQDVDECLSLHIIKKYPPESTRGKSVIELQSGCGLVGIVFNMLGSNVRLTDSQDQLALLQKNIEINNLVRDRIEARVLEWGGDTSSLEDRYYDYVVAATDIEYIDEEKLNNIIKTIINLCGNGTRLVIGYRRSFADSDQKFRQKLDRYFDLKLSHMAIYETPKHEIVIIQATRRPFSSFFEKFKELELAGKSGENV